MNVFRFELSENHIESIIEWINSHSSGILEYQRRVLKPPDRTKPYYGMTLSVFVFQITPVSAHDWHTSVSLYRGIFPQVEPLILENGIELKTAFSTEKPNRDTSWDSRFRTLLHQLTITHGFYEHLIRLGWTLARAREYEYIINPTSIGAESRARLVGSTEWILLDDPNFEP